MHCPKCGCADWQAPCPKCGFDGEPGLVETLSNLNFLLAQLGTWEEVPESVRENLRRKYGQWRRQVEVVLGLRQPPLDAQAAQAARLELMQVRALLDKALPSWVSRGWLHPSVAQELEAEARERAERLTECLLDAPSTKWPRPALCILSQARFLAQLIEDLHASGRLADATVYPAASAELNARIEELEIDLGLRRRPPPAPKPLQPEPASQPVPSAQPLAPPRPPRRPLTWERVWETLLSERTLHALLFLGVFLLFAAAVSLVVWNWEALPPWLQVIFLALFTAVFYALGWYVRVRLRLRGSGIALSAVASLLVPLDFYAFYLSGGFPPERWAEVWLLASAVCLVAYALTIYLVQAGFFGYLVGAAAGSLLAAGMQVAALDYDWWQAGLMTLGLGLALVGERLSRRQNRWRVMAIPLWHVALAAAATIPPLAFGWALTGPAGGEGFWYALSVDWWLAGLLFALAADRYRLRLVALVAAACFPVAVWVTERALWDLRGIEWAWYALGWALLSPAYLLTGWALGRFRQRLDSIYLAYGRTAVGCGVALIVLAALWPLMNLPVAVFVHLILAATLALAARLWQRPRLLAFSSFLLLSAVTAWVVSGGMTVAHLGLAWALLAILHLIVALRLRGGQVRYDAPLYGAGWLVAGLALLPPLMASNRPILTYALANWMAINGWLASLAHAQESPGLRALLQARRWSPVLFHWAAALPLPAWLWLAWGGTWPAKDRGLPLAGGWVEIRLEWLYLLAAWALLGLGRRLQRHRWAYGTPWHTVAQLNNLAAWLLPLAFYDQAGAALSLLLASGFYFASVPLMHSRWWLVPGALIFPAGWVLGLDWLGLAPEPLGVALAGVSVTYSLAGWWLGRRWGVGQSVLLVWNLIAQYVALLAFMWQLSPVVEGRASDATLLWAAAGQLTLGISFGLQAWTMESGEVFGHVAAWLGVIAGGLAAAAYSQGRGSSAAKAALLAVLYVLAERGLYRACLTRWPSPAWRHFVRRAWRLYRRPLLVAGWSISAGAIGLALVRNLLVLGGGRTRESWSVLGLLGVTGLYALGAWLFRRQRRVAYRLVWLASSLVVLPWTLLTHLGWYVWGAPPAPRYALGWVILALLESLLGAGLMVWGNRRLGINRWGRPPTVVAHLLVPLALLWGVADVDTSILSVGLGILFYLIGLRLDRWRWRPLVRPRFLYPAAALVPVWAIYLLARFAPSAPQTTYGLMLLGLTLPALLVGRWLERGQPAYRWPVYLVAYGVALAGTVLVAHQRPVLIGALLFDALVALISAWTFRESWWMYPASAALPAALVLALLEWRVPASRHGWALIGLGGGYLLAAWRLRRARADAYAIPLLAAAFALIGLGLPPSSQDRLGAFAGYGGAAVLYGLSAWGMGQPLLLTPAVGLAIVPYWLGVLELELASVDYGLALWPGILLALLAAYRLDERWGVELQGLEAFPWLDPSRWAWAAAERLARWWALPCYAVAYGGAALGALLSWDDAALLALTLALAAFLYGLATLRFRLRGWLLVTTVTAQLAALSAIDWLGLMAREVRAGAVFMAFTPVTWATALVGLALQRHLNEAAPLPAGRVDQGLEGDWRIALRGWSRPLYWMAGIDLLVSQALTLKLNGFSAGVSLSHMLLLGLLATVWRVELLAYLPPLLGLLALGQDFVWRDVGALFWPVALAWVALIYGLAGCSWRYLRRRGAGLPEWVGVWERPLWLSGWVSSIFSINLAVLTGVDVPSFVGRALFDWGQVLPIDVPQVQMVVGVMAILGLLYLAYALTDRHLWLGYAAVGLLLGAWGLEWLLVWGLREVQWYAVPVGVYLLGIGYLEWRFGNQELARWVDRAALLLLLGSAFWQSLGEGGWAYALLMGVEGLGLVWWGSARRLRRFLYVGVAGVVLDVANQLVEPLLSANVIVLALAGLSLILLATLIERRLETVRLLSRELRERLEAWE